MKARTWQTKNCTNNHADNRFTPFFSKLKHDVYNLQPAKQAYLLKQQYDRILNKNVGYANTQLHISDTEIKSKMSHIKSTWKPRD